MLPLAIKKGHLNKWPEILLPGCTLIMPPGATKGAANSQPHARTGQFPSSLSFAPGAKPRSGSAFLCSRPKARDHYAFLWSSSGCRRDYCADQALFHIVCLSAAISPGHPAL